MNIRSQRNSLLGLCRRRNVQDLSICTSATRFALDGTLLHIWGVSKGDGDGLPDVLILGRTPREEPLYVESIPLARFVALLEHIGDGRQQLDLLEVANLEDPVELRATGEVEQYTPTIC